MSAAKHTPGPWAVTRVGMLRAVHPAGTSNERFDIVRVCPSNYHPDGIAAADAEADANAALIAAAPDLLAALRDAVAFYDDRLREARRNNWRMPSEFREYNEPSPSEAKRRDAARAAIAKAEGRS